MLVWCGFTQSPSIPFLKMSAKIEKCIKNEVVFGQGFIKCPKAGGVVKYRTAPSTRFCPVSIEIAHFGRRFE